MIYNSKACLLVLCCFLKLLLCHMGLLVYMVGTLMLKVTTCDHLMVTLIFKVIINLLFFLS